jgi:adenylate cyclase
VRGVAGEVDLCELLWRSDGEATLAPAAQPVPPRPAALSLTCGGREYIHRRGREEITIGRDESCDFVVADAMASRQHCTIERRVDRFVLTDHSANGTYVSIDGETEAVLHRAELVLHKSGWIAFGQPRLAAAGAMQFSCREPA